MKKTMLIAAVALAGCTTVCSTTESVAQPRPEGVYTTGKDIQFKLGIAPYTYHKYDDFDQILEFAKLHELQCTGIKYFMVRKGVKVDNTAEVRAITDAEIAACKEKAANAGVKISSIGPVYMSTEDQCDCAFEFAQRMGVDVVVAVPFKMVGKKRVENRELCLYASKKCAETGIKYAIHNHGPDMPELFPTGRSAYDMIKDMDRGMGLCLDIGHDFRAGYDPVDSIRNYGDRLWDVHLKNVSDCTKKGRAMQFPRGKIDMVEIAKALKEIEYAGALEIEYERDFTNNVPGMAESVGYFRGVMDSLR
jgi:sugar phosphate isomerase/epimerase